MFTTNVHTHMDGVKFNAKHYPPDSNTSEFATLCIEGKGGNVCIFFHDPDKLLDFITAANQLHCDWLKVTEERLAALRSVELGEAGA